MSTVDININEAKVTAINEFTSRMGYGLDVFIEAKSSYCTVYLQVVIYDDEARKTHSSICEGDYVRVTGMLKEKTYTKKDGSAGYSLIIEKPVVFSKIVVSNGELQSPQATDNSKKTEASSAGEVSALSAENPMIDNSIENRVMPGFVTEKQDTTPEIEIYSVSPGQYGAYTIKLKVNGKMIEREYDDKPF